MPGKNRWIAGLLCLAVSPLVVAQGFQFVQAVSGLRAVDTGPSESDLQQWAAVWNEFAQQRNLPITGSDWSNVDWGYEDVSDVPATPYPNLAPGSVLLYFNYFTNVDFLSHIEELDSLSMYGNPIANIDGLSRLRRVNLDLNVGGSSNLTSLEPLSSLTYVGRRLNFHCSGNLTDLSGLANIEYVGEMVRIPRGVSANPGFTPIPSDAWLCRAENSALFPYETFNGCDIAQQSEVCG